MKNLCAWLIACLLLTGSVAYGAAPGAATLDPFPGNLPFSDGGIFGRHIVINEWSSTRNYPPSTIIQHNDEVYIALADTAAGDEPGVDTDWLKVSNDAGIGRRRESE